MELETLLLRRTCVVTEHGSVEILLLRRCKYYVQDGVVRHPDGRKFDRAGRPLDTTDCPSAALIQPAGSHIAAMQVTAQIITLPICFRDLNVVGFDKRTDLGNHFETAPLPVDELAPIPIV